MPWLTRLLVPMTAFSLAAAGLPPTPAALTPSELRGLWSGMVSHRGETSPIALELEPGDDGKVATNLSLPAIHLRSVALGRLPLAIDGTKVQLGSFALVYDRAGGVLRGTVPESLAPVYALPFELRRVDALDADRRRPPEAPTATPVWTYEAGAPLWAGATVHQGLVLAGGDDGRLHALEAGTGRSRWVFRAGGAIRTRAVAAGDTAYLQADDGLLYALNAATGEERWRVRVVAAPVVRKPFSDPTSRYDRYGSDVTVAGGKLYVGTHDGRLLCLDPSDGRRVWQFASGDAVLAAPALTGGRVFFGSFDGHVYALEAASGRLVWKHDTGKPVVSTPAVAGNRVVVGSRSYDLLGLEAATGSAAWQRYVWFSWIESSPAVRDGVAYVGSSDAALVLAVDAATGRVVWQADVWGWAWGQPAVTERRVYIGTAGQRGYPAPHRGSALALDRATGRPVWQHVVEPSGDDTYGFTGSPAAAEGLAIFTGLDGKVYAFGE